MATNDPKSRLTEGNLNSPYPSPNGIAEQRGIAGETPGVTAEAEVGRRDDETAGEKIGRFFRRAMDRLAGRDEEGDRPRDETRSERDRDQLSDRTGGWQPGHSGRHERSQGEWSDLGRSRDDRSLSYRGGPSGDTGRSYGSGQGTTGRPYGQGQGTHGQGTTGRPYGQGQATYGQGSSFGQRTSSGQESDERDQTRFGSSVQSAHGQSGGSSGQYGQSGQSGPSFENRGGRESGFQGDQGRDEWSRGDWTRQERGSDRGMQSGASGVSPSYAGAGASFGFGRDEERAGEWGETARDRDRGQGRRFWQREPLAARDVMTRNPRTVSRQSPIREAAIIMRDENCGVVPVVDASGRLQGLLTDRDIVVRGLVDEAVQRRMEEVMTDDVSAVTEDEPLTSVLDLMGRKQVRRVPVVDRNDRLLGIISMADIANRADYDEDLQDAFERISSRRSFWSLFS